MDNNLFNRRLQAVLDATADIRDSKGFIDHLLRIMLVRHDPQGGLAKLYFEGGPEILDTIVRLAGGTTIVVPNDRELRNLVLTAVCYYYREMLGKSWPEVKEALDRPDLDSVRMGVQVGQLKRYITMQTKKMAETRGASHG